MFHKNLRTATLNDNICIYIKIKRSLTIEKINEENILNILTVPIVQVVI